MLNRNERVNEHKIWHNPEDIVILLNKNKAREHLIEHDLLDIDSVKLFIKNKTIIDSHRGCKVRAIISNNHLVGWCGIPLQNDQYEIAIAPGAKLHN